MLLRVSIGAALLLVLYGQLCYLLKSVHPIRVEGTVSEGFEHVRELFRVNFEEDWEPEGAAFAVYHNGRKVVDLWGGYADRQSARPWRSDTITITFSTTKAVAAICIAKLVDQGHLRYDDLVSKFWPDFGKNGKRNVTVQMALSHMAGLSYVDSPISEDIARDHIAMRKLLEDEYPKFPPGTTSGYHPYTFGWIVDQIVRHTDPKKRGIGQFLREEITNPNNIDYHIGLPLDQSYRVARVRVPSLGERLSEVWHNHHVIVYFRHLFSLLRDTPLKRAVSNPSWLQAVAKCTMNNPEYYSLEQAAALGIGNARSLAELFNLVLSGKIIKSTTLDIISHFHVNTTDFIFGDQVAKGHGFLYLPSNRAGTEHVVGHTGHGCQQVFYDRKNNLAVAYVTNGLKTGLYNLCRTYYRLHEAVYDVLESNH